MPHATKPLTHASLADAARELAARDADLAGIVAEHGPPPMWPIEPGFGGLINVILGQQVSVASAQAAWQRLTESIGDPPQPAALLELSNDAMRAIGFSRQKSRYVRDLARQIAAGELDPTAINQANTADDDTVREVLMQICGIGRWSADIYLVLSLRRPDIWPRGDLALNAAARENIAALPGDADEAAIEAHAAELWRPWRSVAARILWMAYLKERGRPL